MAVGRAWLNKKGEIKKALTEEEKDLFNERMIKGLNRLACMQVMDELSAGDCAMDTADQLSLMYGKVNLIIK